MNDNFENPALDLGEYPNTPGHRGVETSVSAADDLAPHLGRLQLMVKGAILDAGEHGLTADECSDVLQLDRWTVQPRTSELKVKGIIKDSGLRRRNRTGKAAIVWIDAKLPAVERKAA